MAGRDRITVSRTPGPSFETSPAIALGSRKMPEGTERNEMGRIVEVSEENIALDAQADEERRAAQTADRVSGTPETLQLAGMSTNDETNRKPNTHSSNGNAIWLGPKT